MIEQDFYQGLKFIRKTEKPITVIFTKLSMSKNTGGQRESLVDVLPGQTRKNVNDKLMIGFQYVNEPDKIKHIYIHTILEYICEDKHYKLILK